MCDVQRAACAPPRTLDEAIRETELSFVCVGTPSQANGNLDLTLHPAGLRADRRRPSKQKARRHTVVIRSTILPGTMGTDRHSGAGGVLRQEGRGGFRRLPQSGIPARRFGGEGFQRPPEDRDRRIGSAAAATCWRRSTQKLEAPLIRTDLETAEMVKYVDNSWHALKIGFANEIGNLCKVFRHRRPRSDEHLLPGSEAEHFAGLSDAGLCLRRLLPAQGPAGAWPTRPRCTTCNCPS